METKQPNEGAFFNPFQIRIIEVRQRERIRGSGSKPTEFDYDVTLELGEAEAAGLVIQRITMTAVGWSSENLTQKKSLDLMLDTLVIALRRARAGIQPGEGTPAEWLPPPQVSP